MKPRQWTWIPLGAVLAIHDEQVAEHGGIRGVRDLALIEAALARLGQVFVRVDTAETSQLGDWLESIGLRQVGNATTMVKGPQTPPAGPARMFALANQSFN